ncbi:tRNA lysidine(34) synthetase TilS [bacterium c-19]|nr:tRNA lysidine(34) synthetase TilS [bacterium c-19]
MNLKSINKNKRWIVAVSGGSDSMALLHMCVEAEIPIIAAHMNYQKRTTAQRDSDGVQSFCAKHQIPFELRIQEEPCRSNFQAFARKKRYEFFHELIIQYQAQGVLVAHQLDDHLETYLMQQEKGLIPHTFGLREQVEIFHCHVVRPLLAYTKSELEAYCKQHHVPYWLDESNLSDQYRRNQIRHTVIDSMSNSAKQALCEEIAAKNTLHQQYQQQATAFLMTWKYDCTALRKQTKTLQEYILQAWIYATCAKYISKKELETISALINQSNNQRRMIDQDYELHKEYDILYLIKRKEEAYAYTLPQLEYISTPYFSLTDQGEVIEGVTLQKSDFPITIRSYQPGDAITLRFGTKKLNRWFIDRKIPYIERKLWPVMVNAQGKVIFAVKIGCDIEHFSNNPSVFVLK